MMIYSIFDHLGLPTIHPRLHIRLDTEVMPTMPPVLACFVIFKLGVLFGQ